MESELALPSFAAPPLDEVAADMQFSTLPIRAADVGAYHELIAAAYPGSIDVPSLPPIFETAGPAAPTPFSAAFSSSLLPRSWFISADDEHVVQLQPDRLVVNWRVRPSRRPYPRYAEVGADLLRRMKLWVSWFTGRVIRTSSRTSAS